MHVVSRSFVAAIGAACLAVAQVPTLRVVDEPVPIGAAYAAAVDLDGDGDLDLLGNPSQCALSDGSGRFAFATPPLIGIGGGLDVGSFPQPKVAVGNLNGDAAPDFAYVGPGAGGPQSVLVRFGSFPPSFAGGGITLPTPSGYQPRFLELGDPDLDGDTDVIVGGSTLFPATPSAPLVFLNNGSGTFSAAAGSFGMATSLLSAGRFADLDGDGDQDWITCGTIGGFTVFAAQPFVGGAFGPPYAVVLPAVALATHRPEVGDFDGDGLLDVAVDQNRQIAVLRQSAPFVFDPPLAVVATGAVAGPPGLPQFGPAGCVAVPAAGGPGHRLIVVGYEFAQAFVLSGGQLVAVGPPLGVVGNDVGAFDADGDGDLDLLVVQGTTDAECSHRLLFNDGANGFVRSGGAPDVRADASYAAGFADGDAAPDLLGYAQSGTGGAPLVSLNDGYGRFGATTAAPCVGCPPTALSFFGLTSFPFVDTFDADGDGDSDLWVGNVGAGGNRVSGLARNDGSAGFVWTADSLDPPNTAAAKAFPCDVDADGDRDLVVLRSGLPPEARLNLGGGAYSGPTPIPGAPAAVRGLASDLDGDGDDDLILHAPNSVALMIQQAGVLTVGPAYAPNASGALQLVDVDGNGLLDLMVGSGYLPRTGPTAFGAFVPFFAGATFADFDGDGAMEGLDLVSGAFYERVGGLWTAQPGGVPGWASYNLLGSAAGVADFDLDGDADVFNARGRIATSLARQFLIDDPLRPGYSSRFSLHGPANGAWLLAVSPAPPWTPAATPWGRLALDPAAALQVASGVLAPNGAAAVEVFVGAAGAGLVGYEFAFQGVVDGPTGPRLTNARVVPVLSF